MNAHWQGNPCPDTIQQIGEASQHTNVCTMQQRAYEMFKKKVCSHHQLYGTTCNVSCLRVCYWQKGYILLNVLFPYDLTSWKVKFQEIYNAVMFALSYKDTVNECHWFICFTQFLFKKKWRTESVWLILSKPLIHTKSEFHTDSVWASFLFKIYVMRWTLKTTTL